MTYAEGKHRKRQQSTVHVPQQCDRISEKGTFKDKVENITETVVLTPLDPMKNWKSSKCILKKKLNLMTEKRNIHIFRDEEITKQGQISSHPQNSLQQHSKLDHKGDLPENIIMEDMIPKFYTKSHKYKILENIQLRRF